MTTLKPGDEVRVVEHDDSTRLPMWPVARRDPAVVIATEGSYVRIRYTGGPLEGDEDSFWKDSRWRAWDGEFRWRLEPAAVVENFSQERTEGET